MLFITDSEANESLFRETLAHSGLRLHLKVVHSPQEAVSLLKGLPPYVPPQLYPPPEVIIVDLVCDNVDASELLLWLQNSPEWKLIPTVVITSKYDGTDAATASSLRTNALLARPDGREELAALYRSICRVWSLAEPAPVQHQQTPP